MKNLVSVSSFVVVGNFIDSVQAWQEFLALINRLPGVTVINSIRHDFPGGGFSGLVLIAESHAAIHTWPELGMAWVELATCGDPTSIDVFRNYWVSHYTVFQ